MVTMHSNSHIYSTNCPILLAVLAPNFLSPGLGWREGPTYLLEVDEVVREEVEAEEERAEEAEGSEAGDLAIVELGHEIFEDGNGASEAQDLAGERHVGAERGDLGGEGLVLALAEEHGVDEQACCELREVLHPAAQLVAARRAVQHRDELVHRLHFIIF